MKVWKRRRLYATGILTGTFLLAICAAYVHAQVSDLSNVGTGSPVAAQQEQECMTEQPKSQAFNTAAAAMFDLAQNAWLISDSVYSVLWTFATDVHGTFDGINPGFYGSALEMAHSALAIDPSKPEHHLLVAQLEWQVADQGEVGIDSLAAVAAWSHARCARQFADSLGVPDVVVQAESLMGVVRSYFPSIEKPAV